jgi:porin
MKEDAGPISKLFLATLSISLLCISIMSSEVLSAEAAPEDINTPKVYPVKDNPGSIISQLDKAEEERDYLFQFPGVAGPMKSYNEWKANLNKKYGIRYLAEWAALYQKASDTFGTEDEAAGYDLEFNGTWTFLGKDMPTYSMLGLGVFQKKPIGTELTPLTLFTQYGSLYPGGTAYGDNDLVVGELWYQQRIQNKFGFRIGYVFPLTAYDFFPFKNFRTDFVDQNNVANTSIPLPLQGFGGFVQYKPTPKMFFRFGLHDANADPYEFVSETYNGELFYIFEFGMDTDLVPRKKGSPPAGHVHVSAWHQDAREDFGISRGTGVTATATQQFGQFHPFIRYGYADVDADGPTFARQMFAVGTAVDKIFGQSKDRIAVSVSWVEPTDDTKNNQTSIDAYYRVQLTPQIQFGPTLGIVFDPVDNPEEDTVCVVGLRTRIYF